MLGSYYTFSKRDLEIINKRRREENRLGFAVQLVILRYPGWPYTHIKSIPNSVIHYISKQIGSTPSSLSLYPQRENTLCDHLKEIRNEYDFVTFTLKEYRMTFKLLHQLALENGDAIHLLHEKDLNIEEHYTDTAGYTDQIFGLTHLLGFKFAPRIRDLSDSKLFTIDKASEYPKLEAILRGQINTKVIKENYQDVLRLAHFIKERKVSASLIMGKLGSYSRQNSLATALREMGRIEKTIFILNYISDESLRRKIQKGLNKREP